MNRRGFLTLIASAVPLVASQPSQTDVHYPKPTPPPPQPPPPSNPVAEDDYHDWFVQPGDLLTELKDGTVQPAGPYDRICGVALYAAKNGSLVETAGGGPFIVVRKVAHVNV